MSTKATEYAELVAHRKVCFACNGLANPSQFVEFDSEEIGPWSRLHGDLDAQVMIIGQDWGDVKYFEAHRGLDDLANPTMRALEYLLSTVGVNADMSSYRNEAKGVFLTNAILCLKTGGLQASVDKSWFNNCSQRFLRRQVEIVRPRAVIPLGAHAYQALCLAFKLRPLGLKVAVEQAPVTLMQGVQMVPVYHCGRRVQNTHRPLETQRYDWLRVQSALSASLSS